MDCTGTIVLHLGRRLGTLYNQIQRGLECHVNYFAFGMAAGYCDYERFCVFLSVSVRSRTLRPNFTKFHVRVTCTWPWPWLGPLTAMHTLCTSGFVRDVMFVHNGPYGAWMRRRIIKVTHQGAAQGTTS